jgi:Asp-tRNA(Asn)/Glu-tRNA(Gln) amidotransferase A subunit family amidase
MDRRRFIHYFASLGLGSTLMPGALACAAEGHARITTSMVESAAKISGLTFSTAEVERITAGLNEEGGFVSQYQKIRNKSLENDVPPAFLFNPLPKGFDVTEQQQGFSISSVSVSMPDTDAELAYLPVTHLAKLVETRQVTSTELAKLYLARLREYDPVLMCVVTLTEDLALKQAERADQEISAGDYKGPLHGIPYGLKDLFAVRGYRTTWGASPYKHQEIDADAAVFRRLTKAGAVLIAKLATGALASGADWFRGTTRNPWNPKLNSYGSSAGPASATAAGLVGFSVGTETAGSIVSPAAACGLSGLRPSFGRISRYGCMALSWTMDKVGPLCRSAEDCAIVFNALAGKDDKDHSVRELPFNWDGSTDLSGLRLGLWNRFVEREDPVDEDHELSDDEAVDLMRSLGAEIVEVAIPEFDTQIFSVLFSVESGAAFDDLMRSGRADTMRQPPENSGYPDSLRQARFIPAVEYLQANRLRTKMIEDFNEALSDVDLLIGSDIYLTNLTGHPEISVPHGFYPEGLPTTLRLTGNLFGETEILKVAHAFQSKTEYHLRHPSLENG